MRSCYSLKTESKLIKEKNNYQLQKLDNRQSADSHRDSLRNSNNTLFIIFVYTSTRARQFEVLLRLRCESRRAIASMSSY